MESQVVPRKLRTQSANAERRKRGARSRFLHSAFAFCVLVFRGLPRHELRKSAARRVLVEEREVVAVEPLEELVPVDALQRSLAAVARIVDAQHAGIAAAPGALDARRIAAARFNPAPDGVAIGGGLRGALLRRSGAFLRRGASLRRCLLRGRFLRGS